MLASPPQPQTKSFHQGGASRYGQELVGLQAKAGGNDLTELIEAELAIVITLSC